MEKKTILLVEDDGVMRDLIRGVLERQYKVLEAANCHEAFKQINNPLDLALIDYQLPDGDGFDVLKALRDAKPELPVIMITAYSTESLAIQALRSGVTDYLKKPFTFAYLTERLAELLEGKKNGDLPEGEGSREMFIMDCIAALIENNYTKDLTRDELAELARMDKYKFSKAFNGRFGQTLPSYINRVRVKKAAALLLGNTGLTITEVAHSVGYRNVDHFIRAFKSAFGAPPLQYRKNEKPEELVSVPTE